MNDHPQYVKVVNALGHVEHRPWASVYNRIKEKADQGEWVTSTASVLPRRASQSWWSPCVAGGASMFYGGWGGIVMVLFCSCSKVVLPLFFDEAFADNFSSIKLCSIM